VNTDWSMVTDTAATVVDDSSQVAVRIGVLPTDRADDGYTVALTIADTPAVTVTDQTAIELGDLLIEAVAERAIHVEQARQHQAAALANQLDHAVLTQRQWTHLRQAVTDTHAQRILRAAAPESWTDQDTTEPPELDDDRYDTYLALIDSFDTAENAAQRLRALGVPQDLITRARRRLAREDAETTHHESRSPE